MQRTVILCVVFGAFGDLFKKKLLRALYYFWQDKPEQDELRVILTDIKDLTQEGLDKDSWLDALGAYNELQGPEFVEFCRCLSYRSVNCLDKKTHFQQLRKEMDRVKEEVQGQDEVTLKRFYYLALPPAYFLRTFNSIKSCLELNSSEGDRMILEKPIGIDREFSRDLYDHIGGRFPQPYLRTMDHFGFKPHVPYLLSKLYGDPARNELYTEVHVERVLFYAYEKIGAEERDFPGTLLDSIQSHMLYLYGLCWEDPLSDKEEERWKPFPNMMRAASLCLNFGTEEWRGVKRWEDQSALRAAEVMKKWTSVATPEFYAQLGRAVDERGEILPWHTKETETAARLVFFPAGPRWLNRTPFEIRHAKYADRKEAGIRVYLKPHTPPGQFPRKQQVWHFVVDRDQTNAAGENERQHGLIEETHLTHADGSVIIQEQNKELISISSKDADGYPEAVRELFLDQPSAARLLPAENQFSALEFILSFREYLLIALERDPSRWMEYPLGENPFPKCHPEFAQFDEPPGFWVGPWGKARERSS